MSLGTRTSRRPTARRPSAGRSAFGALAPLSLAAFLALALPSCSINKMATNSVANSITKGPDVYGTDDDPELIRDALPFGLKTMESLLATLPEHEGLLLTLCRGYTQYAYAFVQSEGDLVVNSDYARSEALHQRAYKLYLRAHGYGLRGLEVHYKGITSGLQTDPAKAVARIQKKDVPMLYWTAASWGSAIAMGKDRPEMLADLPAVRALVQRGLALDESYEAGALHEAMIVLEALPAAMGGSVERARQQFDRAVELSHGERPGTYVTMALSVSVMSQNRAEFRSLLDKALAIDPEKDPANRLQTIVTQRKARSLLERQDEFFVDDASASDTTRTKEK